MTAIAKRVLPIAAALTSIAVGWWVGKHFASIFLSLPSQCDLSAGRYVTGGLGGVATVMSFVSFVFNASEAGFLDFKSLYRFVLHGVSENYRWLTNAIVLALVAFAVSGLASFSWGAALMECEARSPPKCNSEFRTACKDKPTEAECWRCNMQEELRAARADIRRLQLQRVGVFPLVFENADTVDDQLGRGVQLTADQFESWHTDLLARGQWPATAADDLAYCVVGYSSRASFSGRYPEVSNDLNVQAARCRASSSAKQLFRFLERHHPSPQVASCASPSFDAMYRPQLLPDAQQATSDEQLVSRSVFVHAFSPADEGLGAERDGLDIGASCRKFVARQVGIVPGTLSCSALDASGQDRCPEPTEDSQQ